MLLEREVVAVLALAALEFAIMRSLVATPLVLLGSYTWRLQMERWKRQEEKERVGEELAEWRKLLSFLDKAPVTPPETSLWFNKVRQRGPGPLPRLSDQPLPSAPPQGLVSLWHSYVHPLLASHLVPVVQEHLDRRLPAGSSLRLENLHLGLSPPQFSGFKVVSTKGRGGAAAFEVDLKFLSDQACIELAGTLGQPRGLLRKSPVRVRVDMLRLTGTLRIVPVDKERLLLWSFKEAPKVTLGYKAAAVEGSGRREVAVEEMDLQRTLASVLEEGFTLPRRQCISLSTPADLARMPLSQVRASTLQITVHGCKGLPTAAEAEGPARPSASLRTVVRARCGTQQGVTEQAHGCDPVFRESFSFSLEEGTEGQAAFEVCRLPGGGDSGDDDDRAAASADRPGAPLQVLGRALVDFKNLDNGTVAVWATGEGLMPVAKRLDGPGGQSWVVRVPLLGLSPAYMVLEASLADWATLPPQGVAQADPPAAGAAAASAAGPCFSLGSRSALPRLLSLHLTGLDWKGTVGSSMGSTDQHYVRILYGDEELSTRCHSLADDEALWDERFLLEESYLAALRRIRFRLMRRAAPPAEPAAEAPGAGLVRGSEDVCVATAVLNLDTVKRSREVYRLLLLGEVLGESGRLFVEVEAVAPGTEAAGAAHSIWDARSVQSAGGSWIP